MMRGNAASLACARATHERGAVSVSDPQNATAPTERRGRAIAYRIAAATMFAVMAALIKLAVERDVAVVEIMFWRFAFGVPPLFLYIAMRSNAGIVRTRRIGAHVWRAGIGLLSMYVSFRAVALLPLAEATTIGFAAPLFAIALSALVLHEKVGPRRWTAVIVGFAGVMIVADPGHETLPAAGLAFAVAGAIGVAAVTIAIRRISRTEAPETIVFWFSALSLPVLGAFLPGAATPHDTSEWAILIALGLTGGAAQLFMTGSLSFARISVVAPFDYVQLVWAVLLGWVIWNSVPTAQTWFGAAVIAGCGVYSAYRERGLQQAAKG